MKRSTRKNRKYGGNEIHMVKEMSVYQEQNGRVLKDEHIKEIVDNNRIHVEGYDNGRLINYTKIFTPVQIVAKPYKQKTRRKNGRRKHTKSKK